MVGMREKRTTSVDWPKRLKALRERHKLTQEEAAERLGVPVATFRNWEQGRTMPRGAAVQLIALVFPE